MLFRRLASTARSSPLSHHLQFLRPTPTPTAITPRHLPRSLPLLPNLTQRRSLTQDEIDDPEMNGNYPNPPRENRQHRDPYGDWWDKQERRNFGEPVHEDNDILGMLSLEEQRHITPGKAAFQIGVFVSLILALCGVVSVYYPDRPSAVRRFPGGLDRELGGKGALLAPSDDDDDADEA